MQVVSGAFHREKVHYVAPPANRLEAEMSAFLDFFNAPAAIDPIIKAAVAHLWFVAIHPFDDGNGRITRAIADMALARADAGPQRLYSMSAAIEGARGEYYDALKATTTGENLDLTNWIKWFVGRLGRAVGNATATLDNVLFKADFWQAHSSHDLNARQTKVLNRLLDGDFEGKLTSTKWAKLTKTSQDTAARDIADLVAKGLLRKGEAGGRSTAYELKRFAADRQPPDQSNVDGPAASAHDRDAMGQPKRDGADDHVSRTAFISDLAGLLGEHVNKRAAAAGQTEDEQPNHQAKQKKPRPGR